MIKRMISLFFLFILIFSFHLSTSHADQLVTTVNGTNVNLDWSTMPEAQSYTLYYALADFKGDIDIATLGSIEMGSTKSLYVPGLPSGLVIYVAILAHASQDVISNIVKFMGFGGTVSFPETGDVLMSVDDPGGIGNFSVVGTRSADGSDISISQISGNDGSGPFALQITDDKPVSYKKGDLTVTFIYHADGSVGFEAVQDNSFIQGNSVALLAAYATDGAIDCSQYADIFEYKQMLQSSTSNESLSLLAEVRRRGGTDLAKIKILLLHATVLLSTKGTGIHDPRYQKLAQFLQIVTWAYEGLEHKVLGERLSTYDEQCNTPEPPVGRAECGECAIPSGAQYGNVDSNGMFTEYYLLNGRYVGPFMKWYDNNKTRPAISTCFDENGEPHEASCIWDEDGATERNEYDHGVRLERISWYPSGNLRYQAYYQNGHIVETISYYDSPGAHKIHQRFKDDRADGLQEHWYENGNRRSTSYYVGGKLDGRETHYLDMDNGTVDFFCDYENGVSLGCTWP